MANCLLTARRALAEHGFAKPWWMPLPVNAKEAMKKPPRKQERYDQENQH